MPGEEGLLLPVWVVCHSAVDWSEKKAEEKWVFCPVLSKDTHSLLRTPKLLDLRLLDSDQDVYHCHTHPPTSGLGWYFVGNTPAFQLVEVGPFSASILAWINNLLSLLCVSVSFCVCMHTCMPVYFCFLFRSFGDDRASIFILKHHHKQGPRINMCVCSCVCVFVCVHPRGSVSLGVSSMARGKKIAEGQAGILTGWCDVADGEETQGSTFVPAW